MLRRIGSFTGLFAGLLCLCAAVGGYALNVDEENVPLKLLAGTERMIYKIDQKVPITVYLKNIGENPVEIVEPAIDKRSFFFEITFPDGKKDKLLDIYGLSLQKITLPPKKRIKFTASFTPEFSGEYHVEVRYFGYNDATLTAAPVIIHVVKPVVPK